MKSKLFILLLFSVILATSCDSNTYDFSSADSSLVKKIEIKRWDYTSRFIFTYEHTRLKEVTYSSNTTPMFLDFYYISFGLEGVYGISKEGEIDLLNYIVLTKTNEDGFITSALYQKKENKQTLLEMSFIYNSNGYLTQISERLGSWTTTRDFSYCKNGDLASMIQRESYNEDHPTHYTFEAGNHKNQNRITPLWLDHPFFLILHQAGLLGRFTKHLAVSNNCNYGYTAGKSNNYSYLFDDDDNVVNWECESHLDKEPYEIYNEY